MASWEGGPFGTPRRPRERRDRRPSAAVGYLIGVVGGAAVVAVLAAAALRWDWVGRLRGQWERLNVTSSVSDLAARGDEKVTDVGGVLGNITGAISNQRNASERRLQGASQATGAAARRPEPRAGQ